MSEPEDDSESFLARWSRRKRDAAERPAAGQVSPEQSIATQSTGPSSAEPPAEDSAFPDATVPAFDPASLPSIEEISATTDIRGFLRPGVPGDLTRAALRRVWSTDPAIRDFVGLQENDWDFNALDGKHGFGPISPSADLDRQVADMLGTMRQSPLSQAAASEMPALPSEDDAPTSGIAEARELRQPPEPQTNPRPDDIAAVRQDDSGKADLLQSKINAAMQYENPPRNSSEAETPLRHGGALPKL